MGSVRAIVLMFCFGAGAVSGQEAGIRLAVPEALEASGFAQYLTPRFSLKTGIRITRIAEDAEAEMAFGVDDTPLFEGLGQRWSLRHNNDPRAIRFLEWMQSDIGKRTITSFIAPDGTTFSTQIEQVKAVASTTYDGDPVVGERLSFKLCGRCHVINDTNRMKGMGATPSFGVLRGLPEWETRFATFFLLNPHPSFTQIRNITDPFDPTLPPPIVPLEMRESDVEDILTYVAGIEPADLGAPLQLQ